MPRNRELELRLMNDPQTSAFFDAVRDEFLSCLGDPEVRPAWLGECIDVDHLADSNVAMTLADLAAYAALEVTRRLEGKESLRRGS